MTTIHKYFANRRVGLAAIIACFALSSSTGCGPDYKARGTVRGKVKTGNKLLTTGSVMFVNKQGVSASASITVDGTYEMLDAPVGECTVTVTVSALPMDPSVAARLKGKSRGPAMPAGPKPPDAEGGPAPPSSPSIPKEVVTIDKKYSDPATSGLTFTVKKGEQTYDIDL